MVLLAWIGQQIPAEASVNIDTILTTMKGSVQDVQ